MRIGAGILTYQQGEAADGAFEREAVRRAEAAGFESVWFSEHHFSPDGYLPSSVPAMADALAHTTTVGLGTAVALLPFHDIPRLDAGLRVLEAAGRVVRYGVGMGYRDEEFDGFGLRRRDRAGRFERGLVELRDRLAARESAVELWVGAVAPAAIDRAARLRLPVLFSPGASVDEIARRIGRYREARGERGRFAVVRDVAVGGAVDSPEQWFERYVVPMYLDYLSKTVLSTPDGPVLGAAIGPAGTEAFLSRFRANAVVAEQGRLDAELARLEDLGVELAVLRAWYPAAPRREQLRAMDRLAGLLPARLRPETA